MTAAGTPVSASPRSSVHGCTDAQYLFEAARRVLDELAIGQPGVDDLARDRVRERDVAADVEARPTGRPTGRTMVRRGSIAISRAPRRIPFSRWWKKIGCVSRAFDPHSRTQSVSSISR